MNNFDKKILLVEDDYVTAKYETVLLTRHGYNIILAASGEDAIAVVKQIGFEIDLILMDIDLGTGCMNGIDTSCEILKEADIPIVFLSSHTEKEIIEKTEKITSYGYIVKNSGETILLASIKMAFKLHDALQKIKKSETKFRQIAENIKEVFWIRDNDTKKIAYISPGYEKIWGRACHELYDNPQSFIETIHPDDKKRVIEAQKRLHTLKADCFDEEYRIVRPDGDIRWIWAKTFFVRDDSGAITRYVGIAEDITDRKLVIEEYIKKENFLTFILEHTSDIIFLLDKEYCIKYINHTVEGFEKTIVINTCLFDYIDKEYAESVKDEIDKGFSEGKRGEKDVIVAVGDNGKKQKYKAFLTPLIISDKSDMLLIIASKIN